MAELDTPVYLSEEKYNALQTELVDLKTRARKEIAEQLEFSKSLGDLSENAEYHEARDRQADTEDRIASLEDILKRAKIVSAHHSLAVEVGSMLSIKKPDGGEQDVTIVGSEEADVARGLVSHLSPLGAALLGHKKGDEVTVRTPKGENLVYKIKALK